MENGDSNEKKDLIKTILDGLKEELNDIRSELKNDLKSELDDIRSTLKEEIDDIRNRTIPPHDSDFPPQPPRPSMGFVKAGFIVNDEDRESKTFDISDFEKIRVGGMFDVEITRSDSYRVEIEASNRFFKNLDVSREGDSLLIRHSRHIGWRAALSRPRVEISLPVLKELHITGAASVTISGFDSSDTFKLDMSGASSINGDISCGNADFDLSGASRARLIGSTGDAVIRSSGANRIDLSDFVINNTAVKLSGASHLSAHITGRLDARISGASYFGWRGEPTMGDIRTSGAARLNKEQ